MTTEERVIAQVAEANPVSEPASPTAQERAEAERLLRRVLDGAPSPARRRPRLGFLAPVVSLVVVLVVAAVALRTGGSSTTGSGGNGGGLTITFSAQPTAQTPQVTSTAMSREVAVMRRRLASLGRGFTVAQSEATGIVVTLPKARTLERTRIVQLITQPARLRFYDWEANVLTPNGRTVASQLAAQNATAMSMSQGGNYGAGASGAGGTSLYDAVRLAARQPTVRAGGFLSRLGPEYYMFGGPGSSACAAAARQWGVARPISATHCLLAGPLDLGPVSRQRALEALAAQLPIGVTASQGQVVAVPQGTIVLESAQLHGGAPAAPVPVFSPAAQFFVLRDHVALTGAGISHPRASTDQTGAPDVTFGFNAAGQTAFEKVTKAIAHRGTNVTLGAAPLDQHFAVALDNQLLTVPQIDYRQYPDGIIGGGGADVTGGFTAHSARDLATELRYGALPLSVRVVP